ncbi:phosphoenolpyruvate-dependent sugarphosphotransferase system, partial [Striga asiatica]
MSDGGEQIECGWRRKLKHDGGARRRQIAANCRRGGGDGSVEIKKLWRRCGWWDEISKWRGQHLRLRLVSISEGCKKLDFRFFDRSLLLNGGRLSDIYVMIDKGFRWVEDYNKAQVCTFFFIMTTGLGREEKNIRMIVIFNVMQLYETLKLVWE